MKFFNKSAIIESSIGGLGSHLLILGLNRLMENSQKISSGQILIFSVSTFIILSLYFAYTRSNASRIVFGLVVVSTVILIFSVYRYFLDQEKTGPAFGVSQDTSPVSYDTLPVSYDTPYVHVDSLHGLDSGNVDPISTEIPNEDHQLPLVQEKRFEENPNQDSLSNIETYIGVSQFPSQNTEETTLNINKIIFSSMRDVLNKNYNVEEIKIEAIERSFDPIESTHSDIKKHAENTGMDVIIWGSYEETVNSENLEIPLYIVSLNVELIELEKNLYKELFIDNTPGNKNSNPNILNRLKFNAYAGNEMASISCFVHAMAALTRDDYDAAENFMSQSIQFGNKVTEPSMQFKGSFDQITRFKERYSVRKFVNALDMAIDSSRNQEFNLVKLLETNDYKNRFKELNSKYNYDSLKTINAILVELIANSIHRIFTNNPLNKGGDIASFKQSIEILGLISDWEDKKVIINIIPSNGDRNGMIDTTNLSNALGFLYEEIYMNNRIEKDLEDFAIIQIEEVKKKDSVRVSPVTIYRNLKTNYKKALYVDYFIHFSDFTYNIDRIKFTLVKPRNNH